MRVVSKTLKLESGKREKKTEQFKIVYKILFESKEWFKI